MSAPATPVGDPTSSARAEDEAAFARIPSPRSRHPAIAVAAAALAVFLLVKQRHDIRYALSPRAPLDLGDVAALATTAALPFDRYVRLRGAADRETAVILDRQGDWRFSQFLRLQGAKGRFFVYRVPDPLPVDRAEADVFLGRLIPFSRLSFGESIRRYHAAQIATTHLFTPGDFVAALTTPPPLVAIDRAGVKIALAPDASISLEVTPPDQVFVDLPVRAFPTVAAAQAAAVARGADVVVAVAADRHEDGAPATHHRLTVRLRPETRDAVLSDLGALRFDVRIGPATSRVAARAGALSVGPDGLRVQGQAANPHPIPLAHLRGVRMAAPVAIPDDAVLLIEDARPGAELRTLVVAAFLAAFALVNLLALVRRS